jgi:hypothetical protein
MGLQFTKFDPQYLNIYHGVAKQLLEQHQAEHPDDPVCGVHFSFNDRHVHLHYRKLDGTETIPGREYPANARVSKPVDHIVEAAKLLVEEGLIELT